MYSAETKAQIREDEIMEEEALSPFESLPVEMFLHICSFLDLKDVLFTLNRVCKKFYEILSCQVVWKVFVNKRFPAMNDYPIVKAVENEETDWIYGAFHLERDRVRYGLWGNSVQCDEGLMHTANIDDVLLLKNGTRFLSASRDHTIGVWSVDVDKVGPRLEKLHQTNAHRGWVWRLREINGDIYSASFDGFVKKWALDEADLRDLQSFKCGVSVQCVTGHNNLIYTGTRKTVVTFDPRVSNEPIFHYDAHRSAILTIDCISDDIVTVGEDRSIVLWDTRSGKTRERFFLIRDENLARPTCCSQVFNNVLYVGCRDGCVLLYSYNKGRLTYEYTIDEPEEHKRGITALRVSAGSVMTCSENGVLIIKSAIDPPTRLFTHRYGKILSAADYGYGICAIGTNETVIVTTGLNR